MREAIGVGKTIELAIEDAMTQLGIGRDAAVTTEVLEQPVKKLFRTLPAKVKVMVEEAPKAEPVAPVEVAPVAEEAPVEEVEVKEAPVEAPASEKAPVEKAPKKDNRRRKGRKPVDEEPEEPINIEENLKVKAAVDYLTDVFAAMGVTDEKFSAVQKGEATIIKVEGEEIGVLIGRRGETMESLSYLAGLVANRQEGDYIKLGLDVAGYRGKREADLQQLARRMGAKVRKSGLSHAMDPMNPYERRIVHSTIGQMDGVRSESSGEGKDRHVVIYSTDPEASNLPDRKERSGGNRRDRRDGNRGGRSGGNRRDGGRGGRDNGRRENRGPRKPATPQREFSNRIWDDTVPIAPSRTNKPDEAEGFALYGKIEL